MIRERFLTEASVSVVGQTEAVGAGAADARQSFAGQLRRRQAHVRTAAVQRPAVVRPVRLPVRVVHVHHHQVLQMGIANVVPPSYIVVRIIRTENRSRAA